MAQVGRTPAPASGRRRIDTRRRARRRGLAAVTGLALAAVLVSTGGGFVRDLLDPSGCRNGDELPAALSDAVTAAAELGEQQGLRSAVAVVDVRTGACVLAGDDGDSFATASVVKVMVAARLLVDGAMTGATADAAWAMITRSDDEAGNQLWVQAGGPELEPWIEEHYDLPDLGSANDIAGRWGNTHVSAVGLAQLYSRLVADPAVWPWLGEAMHSMAPSAADGTDQLFGVAAAAPGAAVKQGWASGSSDDPDAAVVNSTGLVAGDRYAVVVLTEGRGNVAGCDDRGFHAGQAAVLTQMTSGLTGLLAA